MFSQPTFYLPSSIKNKRSVALKSFTMYRPDNFDGNVNDKNHDDIQYASSESDFELEIESDIDSDVESEIELDLESNRNDINEYNDNDASSRAKTWRGLCPIWAPADLRYWNSTFLYCHDLIFHLSFV